MGRIDHAQSRSCAGGLPFKVKSGRSYESGIPSLRLRTLESAVGNKPKSEMKNITVTFPLS